MNFKSYRDLIRDVRTLCGRLPQDFDLVIGIARSGLLPATMIALHMNVPLSIIDGGTKLGGKRVQLLKDKPIRKALLVDDTSYGGATMRRSMRKVDNGNYTIKKLAVYVTPRTKDKVDYYH